MNHATEFVPVECLCIPKALFFDKRYEDLSVDAKILYSLLLDRKEMAVRNGWIDRYGAVYVLYSREEMEKHLNVPAARVERALAQLEAHDQMVAVARPYKGRADQIYVRDITAEQIIEQEKENMGRKNTREKKRKQKKDMYCPCLDGEQGMQGVVMTLTAENIKKALKEIFGGNVVDDEAGNEVEEFFIDTEEEKCADGNEAVCDQTEKPDRRYVTDYKNQGYYSLSKKDQRMVDMYVRNYIDMNDQMVARKYVNEWEEMRKKNIGYMVMGPVGTGKSFFAGCIANALMEQGISVMMTNFSRILNELTKYHADKNEIIAGLVSYPLLIIDDLGIERNSEFALEMIYNVVDRRYCTRKPLIVTTNLSYQDMTRKDLDIEHQRIYSRLMEMCFPVIYQGKDLRQKERDLKLEWMKLNGD